MNYRVFLGLACIVAVPVLFAWGCGGNGSHFGDDGGGDADVDGSNTTDGGFQFADVTSEVHSCVNLECQQPKCTGVNTTTISGTVYAPNGTLPLYNVIVYVPNAPLDPFPQGVTCDQCGTLASGAPIAVALTDPQGHFQITNAPAGSNIPVVMQVGKWRREIQNLTIAPCVDNPIGQQVSGVEQMTRLPKNQQEGDMPKIAITTGGCDHLACIMPKIGIDPKEYAAGPTTSSVKPKTAFSFYSGSGSGAPSGSPPATTLWNDVNMLKNFDLAIFSCECTEPGDATSTSYSAVLNYLNAGGRIFTTDFMYVWYKDSTDTDLNKSPWSWPGGAPSGGTPSTIDTAFPKGQALGDWLYYVSGIAPYKTEVAVEPPIKDSFPATFPYGYTFDNVFSIDPKYGLEWAHSGPSGNPTGTPQHPRIVSMNMPSKNAPAQQCGKGVHLDLHITQDDTVSSSYPTGCSNNMREPELVTAFFFFDASSCIQDDKQAPIIPN